MKKNHQHTSRLIPANWRDLHDWDCSGGCLGSKEEVQCSVWYHAGGDDWGGPRPPMHIQECGTFFDRYGQVCRLSVEGSTLSLGVTEALYPPGWDGHTKIGDQLCPTADRMHLSVDGAAHLLFGFQAFMATGGVPHTEHTARGFGLSAFEDSLGQKCSFQDSSLATEAAVWLGVSDNRMHLTTDMIEALIPHFEAFAGPRSSQEWAPVSDSDSDSIFD